MHTRAGIQEPQDNETNADGRAPQPAVAALLLTIPDAARALAVGRTTMYELIGAGAVEVVHIGRAARVPVDALKAFVDRQRGGTVTAPSPAGARKRTAPGRRVPQRGDQGRLFGGQRPQA